MGSCKKRQGVNRVHVGIGKPEHRPSYRAKRGNDHSFSIAELARMPQSIARDLVRMLLGPPNRTLPQKKGM